MIKWEREEGRYSFSNVGYLGKYKAFEITYDGMSNRNEGKNEKLTCYLNGIRPNLGNFGSVDEAKLYAQEKVLPLWLKGSGLQIKGI